MGMTERARLACERTDMAEAIAGELTPDEQLVDDVRQALQVILGRAELARNALTDLAPARAIPEALAELALVRAVARAIEATLRNYVAARK